MKPWNDAWKMTITPSKASAELSDEWDDDSMVLYFDGMPTKDKVIESINVEIVATYPGPPSPMEIPNPVEQLKEEAGKEFEEACRDLARHAEIPEATSVSGMSEFSFTNKQGFIKLELLRLYKA